MNTASVIASASVHLQDLTGHVFDVLTISRPSTPAQAAYPGQRRIETLPYGRKLD